MKPTCPAACLLALATLAAGVAQAEVLQTPTGRGAMKVTLVDSEYSSNYTGCSAEEVSSVAQESLGASGPGPANVSLPYGALRLDLADCIYYTGPQLGIPPPAGPGVQLIKVEFDDTPDPATIAFAFGPTADQATPHWYELRSNIVGNKILFEMQDGALGDGGPVDNRIRSLVTFGVPKYASIDGNFRDLWWGGASESGWGITIDQHRDVLFGVLFAYDNDGAARWFVMPGGSWDAARTTYTGSIYSPKGSADHAALSTSFQPGPAVGTLQLTPTSRETMVLQYTVNGVSGTKQIRRQAFGAPSAAPVRSDGDLWWGGASQSGWGFALAQQYDKFFGVIYDYDAQGNTTWLVAPSMAYDLDFLRGTLYRTSGARWIGVPFEPSAVVVTEVGSVGFYHHEAERATFSLKLTGQAGQSIQIYRQPY